VIRVILGWTSEKKKKKKGRQHYKWREVVINQFKEMATFPDFGSGASALLVKRDFLSPLSPTTLCSEQGIVRN